MKNQERRDFTPGQDNLNEGGKELTPTEETELKANREKLENEMKEFIADILKAEELMIPCRNFVYPEYNIVRLEQPSDSRSISVKELFKALDIPEEKLDQIYEEGRFTENGKQMLVDLIGKRINFYHSPEQFNVDPDTKETFEPKINEKDK